jgi:hypothetical protein
MPKPTEVHDAFLIAGVFHVKKDFLSKEVESVRYLGARYGPLPSF